MKKKILSFILVVVTIFAMTACGKESVYDYELIYDRQYQAVAVSDFDLSEVLIYNKKTDLYISVTNDMLNAEDLNKTKIPGYHIITIKYNGFEFECSLNLVNKITYSVEYKYGLEAVLINEFDLSDVKIKMDIDGNVQTITVTEDMLSSDDLEKLSTEGTHTIILNYLGKELSFSVVLVNTKTTLTYSIENPYKDSVKINEFVLSNIKIKVFDGKNISNIDVNETMLSGSDLAKLQNVGTHTITISYSNYSSKIVVTLIDEYIEDTITYEIYNPYENKEVKIKEFNLSNIVVKESINGKVTNYSVNASMLSVSDVNKLNTIGKHTITITFKTFTQSVNIKLIDNNDGGNNNDNSDISNIANGYYNSAIGMSGNQLKYALRTIINTGTRDTSYDDLRTALPKTDPGSSNGKILLFYLRKDVNAAWDGGKTWNREHVWPQSQGWFKTSGAGSDVHHIRPTDPGENSRRGNTKYGESGSTYEPKDNVKGDVARIIFYLLTRYSQTDSSYPVTKVATSMSMLLDWHAMDPVDSIEIYRNEKAYEIQKNRNPFIDVPEYAYYIWDMSRLYSEHIYDLEITIEIKLVEYFEDTKKQYFI